MKKTGIVLICVIIGLSSGCRKQPAEGGASAGNNGADSSAHSINSGQASPETRTDQPAVNMEPVSADSSAGPSTSLETVTAQPAVEIQKTESKPKEGIAWMTDFEAARKKAAAEGKDLFLNFTGSDWCGWCKRLDKEVFSHEIFIYEAQKHFVFVYVDFPRNKKQSDELKAQNEKLAQRYGAQGFPTIVLAEADGKPYGQIGYQEGGPLPYLEELARMQMQKKSK